MNLDMINCFARLMFRNAADNSDFIALTASDKTETLISREETMFKTAKLFEFELNFFLWNSWRILSLKLNV